MKGPWAYRGTSARLAFLLACASLFLIGYIRTLPPFPGQNGWNIIYPALVGTRFQLLTFQFWWLATIFEIGKTLNNPSYLLRLGTKAKAVQLAIKHSLLQLLVAVAGIFTIALLVGMPFGLCEGWTSWTKRYTYENASANPAVASYAAHHFGGPVISLSLTHLFSAFALMAMATLFFAAVASGRGKAATAGVWLFYFWTSACSFGLIDKLPALDTVPLFSFGYADFHRCVVAVVLFWLTTSALALIWIQPNQRRTFLSVAAKPWFVGAIVVGYSWLLAEVQPGSNSAQKWDGLFLGEKDSIVGYCRLALLVLGISTVAVHAFWPAVDDSMRHLHLRIGSLNGVARTYLLRALGISVGFSAAAGAVILATIWLTGPHNDTEWLPGAAISLLSLTIATLLATLAGIAIMQLSQKQESWLVASGLLLVAGYPLIFRLPNLNPIALYSTDIVSAGGTWTTNLIVAMVASILATGLTVTYPHILRRGSAQAQISKAG